MEEPNAILRAVYLGGSLSISPPLIIKRFGPIEPVAAAGGLMVIVMLMLMMVIIIDDYCYYAATTTTKHPLQFGTVIVVVVRGPDGR